MLVDDEVFLEAAAQGQTVLLPLAITAQPVQLSVRPTACHSPELRVTVLYPASSPYVCRRRRNDAAHNSDFTYNNEIGWDAGGGGTSAFEYSPYWQSPVSPTSAVGKGVPDIFHGRRF